jgi:hypothetical protein
MANTPFTANRRAWSRLHIKHSFTRPHRPQTNGKAERFIQTLLREWAYVRSYPDYRERAKAWLPWLHRYNWHRPHAALDYRPPISRLGLSMNNLSAVRGDPSDFEPAFLEVTGKRPHGLFVTLDPFTSLYRQRIVELAAKNRLPAMYEAGEFVDAGGLMAYGPSIPDLWRRSATYVDKILKGAKPADLPIEQPTKFSLAVNKRTAAALGLKVPQSILLRAERVIE